MSALREMIQKTGRPLGVLLFYCFSFLLSAAQSPVPAHNITTTLKGQVVDSASEAALGNVTIVLQDAGKDQSIKSTLSKENGSFVVRGLPASHYRLILSSVGYESKTIELPAFTSPLINFGKIALVAAAPAQLNEVLVFIEKPLMELNMDKLIYNVDADPESKTGTALELLRKIPLLAIDGDDNLQLNGSTSFRVLINGRSSSLFLNNPTEVFRIMPASFIKSIEVMTNPPSRYEAEGLAGIINLITHRKNIGGYNGSVNIGASSPEGYSLGSYLTAQKGQLGLSVNLGSNDFTKPTSRRHYYREDKAGQNSLRQTGKSNSNSSSQYGSSELSYEPNALNLFTVSYNRNHSKTGSDFSQQAGLQNANHELTEAYRRFTTGGSQWNGNDFGLDYQRSFRKNSEQLLTLSYKWSNSTGANATDVTLLPLLNYLARQSTSENTEDFTEHTTQADYIHPFGKQSLEVGAKTILRLNNSDYFYKNKDLQTGSFVADPTLSNNFDYRQEILGAYASLNLKRGAWLLRAGGRLEHTKVDAHFKSTGTLALHDYVNLIPNINLSLKLQKTANLRLSYTQRLERPGLYYLNPFVDQTDPRNIYYGNPELLPSTNHVFNLTYSKVLKLTSISSSVIHHFTNNAIAQYTTLGSDSVSRTTFGNMGKSQVTGVSLGINTTLFRKLNLNANTNVHYLQFTSLINGEARNNDGVTYNVFGSAAYRLNKGWRVSSNFSYTAPGIFVQGKTAGNTRNSITVNKSFLKDGKARIAATVNNPFREHRRSFTEVNDPRFYLYQESYTVIRQFRISLNYRFGKLQGDITRKKRGIKNDDLKAVEKQGGDH